MGITRKYETKGECVSLFIEENFEALDSTLITELEGWYEVWSFVGEYDEDVCEDPYWYDEDEGLVYSESEDTTDGTPIWNTWFEPTGFVYDWCVRNLAEVAKCGFTLIMHDGEFWGLGVDGAGYSFRDAHFTPLYDAIGLTWHE